MRKLNTRTIHRYLSFFVGIQLVLWSASGLIFCWLPMEHVRGEHLVSEPIPHDLSRFNLFDLRKLISRVRRIETAGGEIVRSELRFLNGQPVYELQMTDSYQSPQYAIYDAQTGEQLSPIRKNMAIEIAQADFNPNANVITAEWLDQIPSSHSEYRGKELPAWRIELNHESGTVIYVSANRGLVTARRNNQWRLFDFFWMLHTMDYQGRDNFNTWLLLFATLCGLTSMASGYWLWWRSSHLRVRCRRGKTNKVKRANVP